MCHFRMLIYTLADGYTDHQEVPLRCGGKALKSCQITWAILSICTLLKDNQGGKISQFTSPWKQISKQRTSEIGGNKKKRGRVERERMSFFSQFIFNFAWSPLPCPLEKHVVQISATPHRPPEVKLSLVNYLDRAEQGRGNETLLQFQRPQNTSTTVKGVEKKTKRGCSNHYATGW